MNFMTLQVLDRVCPTRIILRPVCLIDSLTLIILDDSPWTISMYLQTVDELKNLQLMGLYVLGVELSLKCCTV